MAECQNGSTAAAVNRALNPLCGMGCTSYRTLFRIRDCQSVCEWISQTQTYFSVPRAGPRRRQDTGLPRNGRSTAPFQEIRGRSAQGSLDRCVLSGKGLTGHWSGPNGSCRCREQNRVLMITASAAPSHISESQRERAAFISVIKTLVCSGALKPPPLHAEENQTFSGNSSP